MLARLRAALGGGSRGGGTAPSSTTRSRKGVVPATAAHSRAAARSLDVAVVGGGAGGLAAARELLREGHRPTVFEQADSVGGVWVYEEAAVDARPLGVGDGEGDSDAPPPPFSANATERQAPPLPWTDTAHGSMYRHLRTNLPREVMGYLDYPFSADFGGEQRGGGVAAAADGAAADAAVSPPPLPDPRRYPGHAEVRRYLEAYADAFGLRPCFRLGRRVVRATPVRDAEGKGEEGGGPSRPPPPPRGPRWRVESIAVERDPSTGRLRPAALPASTTTTTAATTTAQTFDALVVANGHYVTPNLPAVAVASSSSSFPGEQLHSHNYRSPDRLRGRRVVVVGASNSGGDVADEIAAAGAELVVLSARGWRREAAAGTEAGALMAADRPNVRRRGMLCALREDGSCAFDDDEDEGDVSRVDAVIYATGYRYTFDFLDLEGSGDHAAAAADDDGRPPRPALLRWRDEPGRVHPLFLHMFPARGDLAPRLSFLGLPWKVVPFPLMQVQARLVARLLSGRAAEGALPGEAAMLAACAAEDAAREAKGAPPRHAHVLDGEQWAYNAELLRMCGGKGDEEGEEEEGEPPIPGSWRARMYNSARDNKRKPHPGGVSAYRARWEDDGTAAEAAAEFAVIWRARRERAPLRGRERGTVATTTTAAA